MRTTADGEAAKSAVQVSFAMQLVKSAATSAAVALAGVSSSGGSGGSGGTAGSLFAFLGGASLATGGKMPGYPSGGYGDPRDTRLARLSPGEYVLDPQDVARAGLDNLRNFRAGGDLRGTGQAAAAQPVSINVPITLNMSGEGSTTRFRREDAEFIVATVEEALRGRSRGLVRAAREATS